MFFCETRQLTSVCQSCDVYNLPALKTIHFIHLLHRWSAATLPSHHIAVITDRTVTCWCVEGLIADAPVWSFVSFLLNRWKLPYPASLKATPPTCFTPPTGRTFLSRPMFSAIKCSYHFNVFTWAAFRHMLILYFNVSILSTLLEIVYMGIITRSNAEFFQDFFFTICYSCHYALTMCLHSILFDLYREYTKLNSSRLKGL